MRMQPVALALTIVNLVLLVLAAFVAYGRFVAVPF
jgi:hypothetical protein